MEEIKRISITDSAVKSIKQAILTGEYLPGQKLPTEAQFCDLLKVSRTTIREALRILQALGYVTMQPGKGAFASDPLPNPQQSNSNSWYEVEGLSYRDLMEVRIAVETLAVQLAVTRAVPEQVSRLQKIHDEYLEAAAVYDPVKLIILDEMFHTTIVSFTNNQLLNNLNVEIQDCFKPYRTKSFTNKNTYKNAIPSHANILDCFYAKDAARAVREMRHHLELSLKDISAAYSFDDK